MASKNMIHLHDINPKINIPAEWVRIAEVYSSEIFVWNSTTERFYTLGRNGYRTIENAHELLPLTWGVDKTIIYTGEIPINIRIMS